MGNDKHWDVQCYLQDTVIPLFPLGPFHLGRHGVVSSSIVVLREAGTLWSSQLRYGMTLCYDSALTSGYCAESTEHWGFAAVLWYGYNRESLFGCSGDLQEM